MSPLARRLLLGVGALSCLVAPPLMLADVQSPIRVMAGLGLFALAPGIAALPWGARRGPELELALVVGTSVAISTLGAQLMLWVGDWSPEAGACLLAAACLAGMAGQLVWGRRSAE